MCDYVNDNEKDEEEEDDFFTLMFMSDEEFERKYQPSKYFDASGLTSWLTEAKDITTIEKISNSNHRVADLNAYGQCGTKTIQTAKNQSANLPVPSSSSSCQFPFSNSSSRNQHEKYKRIADEEEENSSEATEMSQNNQVNTSKRSRIENMVQDINIHKGKYTNMDVATYGNSNVEFNQHAQISKKNMLPSSSTFYYNVLWCKQSTRKHKKWEGDGVLIISKLAAILKDLEGKEIARGTGYKIKEVKELEEGSVLKIGGKECEIQSIMSEDEYKMYFNKLDV